MLRNFGSFWMTGALLLLIYAYLSGWLELCYLSCTVQYIHLDDGALSAYHVYVSGWRAIAAYHVYLSGWLERYSLSHIFIWITGALLFLFHIFIWMMVALLLLMYIYPDDRSLAVSLWYIYPDVGGLAASHVYLSGWRSLSASLIYLSGWRSLSASLIYLSGWQSLSASLIYLSGWRGLSVCLFSSQMLSYQHPASPNETRRSVPCRLLLISVLVFSKKPQKIPKTSK